MQSSLSDIELWNSAMQGDKEAFGNLFYRHYPFLFQFGLKICAERETLEDAIQELFTELWQKKKDTGLQSVKAYLVQSLKYKLYKAYRKERQQINVEKAEESFELSPETFLVRQEENKEQALKVLEALNKLPPRQKEIIYLKIYKGLSYDEISELMNIKYQVVRNLLCQALKTMRSK